MDKQINLWMDGDQWFVAIFVDGAWDANSEVPEEIEKEEDAIEWCHKTWPGAYVKVVANTGC